jgi:hypothetical protein
VILTDREIKIYVQRRLITIDPEPNKDIDRHAEQGGRPDDGAG